MIPGPRTLKVPANSGQVDGPQFGNVNDEIATVFNRGPNIVKLLSRQVGTSNEIQSTYLGVGQVHFWSAGGNWWTQSHANAATELTVWHGWQSAMDFSNHQEVEIEGKAATPNVYHEYHFATLIKGRKTIVSNCGRGTIRKIVSKTSGSVVFDSGAVAPGGRVEIASEGNYFYIFLDPGQKTGVHFSFE
jgi:hypothetical protein